MKNYSLYILFVCLVLASCQTIDFPEPSQPTTPVFGFQGTIDGANINWLAGQEDYSMVATLEKNDRGQSLFKGSLQPQNCTAECPSSLVVKMNAGPNTNAAESIFQTGPKKLLQPSQDSVLLEVQNQSNDRFTYQWKINNEPFDVDNDKRFDRTFPFIPNSTLQLLGNNENSSFSFSMTIPVRAPDRVKNLKATVRTNGEKVIITLVVAPDKDIDIYWNEKKGDASKTFEGIPKGRVMATVVFADQDSIKATFAFGEDLQWEAIKDKNLVLGVKLMSKIIPGRNLVQPNTVEVIYYDPAGISYSSLGATQNENSTFLISSVEEFQSNTSANPTKKIAFDLTCKLRSENGKVIQLTEGTGVFALAYE